MRTEIWNASTEAKFTQIYAELTCQFYKRLSNAVSIITILFSSSGVIMGAGMWKNGTVFPFIACIIITTVQSIKLIVPKLFPTEKEYKKLNDITAFYFAHHLEFDKLWHEFENGEITEKEAREQYYKILAKEKNILKVTNEVLRDDNKIRIRKAEKATDKYFASKQ